MKNLTADTVWNAGLSISLFPYFNNVFREGQAPPLHFYRINKFRQAKIRAADTVRIVLFSEFIPHGADCDNIPGIPPDMLFQAAYVQVDRPVAAAAYYLPR